MLNGVGVPSNKQIFYWYQILKIQVMQNLYILCNTYKRGEKLPFAEVKHDQIDHLLEVDQSNEATHC